MEDFITAIIVAGLFYAVLRFFKISWLKQGFPPSFIYIAGVFAWCTGLALIAAVYSLISLTIELISTFDADTLVPLIVILVILGIGAKLLSDRKGVMDIAHMVPFLRSALFFKSYDARRQELVERQERQQYAQARKADSERIASGQPEDVIDISEEKSGASDDASFGAASSQASTELDMLKRGEGVDITELFKSNTAKLPAHPLYQFVSLIRVDASEKVLSFRMVFPSSATEPELTPEKLQRVKQGVYQVFQALMADQWLKPYSTFFSSVKTSCFRVRKDEFDMVRELLFMTIQMDINQLKVSRGKPFNSAEFGKMATITTEA